MKNIRAVYLVLGFVVGIVYFAACGGAGGVGNVEASVSEASQLYGTWRGPVLSKEYSGEGELTLNADGSYSCTGSPGGATHFSYRSSACEFPTSWRIIGNTLILVYQDDKYFVLPINFFDASNLVIIAEGFEIWQFAKAQ